MVSNGAIKGSELENRVFGDIKLAAFISKPATKASLCQELEISNLLFAKGKTRSVDWEDGRLWPTEWTEATYNFAIIY